MQKTAKVAYGGPGWTLARSLSGYYLVAVPSEIRLFAHLERWKWAKTLISVPHSRDPAFLACQIWPFWRARSVQFGLQLCRWAGFGLGWLDDTGDVSFAQR